MKKQLSQVKKFHTASNSQDPTKPTSKVPKQVKETRIKLLDEEALELAKAIKKGSIEDIAHEIADVLYVTFGTALSFGLEKHMEEVFTKIHKGNMSKFDSKGAFEKSLNNGKVLKGKKYKKPKLVLQ